MNILEQHVRDNFKGMLVIGDIHADYRLFLRAAEYAHDHELFLMSLGDLVDRGPNPFQTVQLMSLLIAQGKGGFTIGNHDNKFGRLYHGAKVILSRDSKKTLEDVGDRQNEFLSMYVGIIENPVYSGFYHIFDNIILVHAASHPAMWDNLVKFDKTAESRSIYGETTGETHSDGYPVRLYNWIDEIPKDKTVLVGHDRMPIFNKAIYMPMKRINNNNGCAIFIDTGCGKGGFLTAAVICHDKEFKIKDYVEFK